MASAPNLFAAVTKELMLVQTDRNVFYSVEYNTSASALHLWIEDPSTSIFHLEAISINLSLIMFKYDTINL